MEEDVNRLISEILRVDPMRIHDGLTPESVPEWDSMHHLGLIIAIEETFNVAFSPDEMDAMRKSIGGLKQVVRNKLHL